MPIDPTTFRHALREALELAASMTAQREYSMRVPIADVVGEIFCLWEDLYLPESPTYNAAFNEKERLALASFEQICAVLAPLTSGLNLEAYQASSEGKQLAEAASRTLTVLCD